MSDMADMGPEVAYQGKRRIVNTVEAVDQVQKFFAEYRRLLAEQERMSQAEALLFSAPSAPPPLDPPTEIPPVETAQPAEVLPDVAADVVLVFPDPLPSPAPRPLHLPPVGQRTSATHREESRPNRKSVLSGLYLCHLNTFLYLFHKYSTLARILQYVYER